MSVKEITTKIKKENYSAEDVSEIITILDEIRTTLAELEERIKKLEG